MKKKTLSRKFMGFALLSLTLALLGLFVVNFVSTMMLGLPGTSINHLRAARDAVYRVLAGTPWLLWLIIALALFAGCFQLLSKRTLRRLRMVEEAVDRVAHGDYDHQLKVFADDDLGELEANVNEMARQVKHAFELQRQVERSRDEFIVNIAHDLRTPLTSVLGYLGLIDEKAGTLETSKEYAKVAYRKAQRLEQLVSDLFEISVLTAENRAFEPELIDARQFLLQVQDEAYPMLSGAGMELNLTFLTEDFLLYCEGNLLARVFDNLIVNAVRYSQEGKKLDITAGRFGEEAVMCLVTHANPIPEAELDRVFEKLYRLEKSRSTQTGGAGLGLSICKSIVELHGGVMLARRTHDGTAFEMRIPARPKEEQSKPLIDAGEEMAP